MSVVTRVDDNDMTSDQAQLIDKMVNSVSPLVSETEQQQLRVLLQSYRDIFSRDKYDCGRANWRSHELQLLDENCRPYVAKVRHYAPAIQQEINKQFAVWEERGIIAKSSATWSSPLLAVPKRNADGSVAGYRICLDMRGINNLAVRQLFPLSDQQEAISRLAVAKFIVKLDFCSAFLACPVTQKTANILSFRVPGAVYSFQVLPYGYKNSLAEFCQLTEEIIRPS